MPSHRCKHPTCPALLPAPGRCALHQPQEVAEKAARDKVYDLHHRDKGAKRFYDSAEWKAARARKLAATPWCEVCRRAFAVQVHHDKPLAECRGAERTDRKNLISCCTPCHSRIERRRTNARRRK